MIYGLALCLGIYICAFICHYFIGTPGVMIWCLILGVFVGNLVKVPENFNPGIKLCEKKLLNTAIILIGLQLNLHVLSELNLSTFLGLITMIGVIIFLTLIIGKSLKLPQSLSFLVGLGNVICGSAAIISCGPLVSEDKEEMGIAVATINVLGSIELVIIPILITVFSFEAMQQSLFIGSSLQAVGHVIAAGHIFDQDIALAALSIKMIRVLCMIPIIIGLCVYNAQSFSLKAIPSYIFGFLICIGLRYTNILPDYLLEYFQMISNIFISISLVAIGMSIQFHKFFKLGSKAFLLGLISASLQLAMIILWIKF